VPELFALVERLRDAHQLRIPAFGHAGDGNIHVNVMVESRRWRGQWPGPTPPWRNCSKV
jgi:FAD/FMN-containing dehydrogenase